MFLLIFVLIVTFIIVLMNPSFIIKWLAKNNKNVLFFIETNKKVVALTIDDGPHRIVTPKILDVLSKYQAHATFFIIGERVEGNEVIMKRIVQEGHELGNHLMDSYPSILLSKTEFMDQMNQTDSILSKYGEVRWIRPGSGWFSKRMLNQIRKVGYLCALGSVYPFDPQIPFESFHSKYILDNIFPGSIIILHDGKQSRVRTANVLNNVIPKLKKKGYKIVSLSDLVKINKRHILKKE